MSVKKEVLKLLEDNTQGYLSGEYMASFLGVSRNAVWKAIRALDSEGYSIDGIPRRGYMLKEKSNFLSEEAIRLHLERNVDVYVLNECDSTNLVAQKFALEGAPHGTCVLSETQTSGRGRLGRDFYSPKGTGLYMSVIIRPNYDVSQAVLITCAASVAVSKAIEEVTSAIPSIKWVNDIYIEEKKVCGILCQAVSDFESGQIDTIIVGIGVNCTTTEFPDEISQIAGSLNGGFSRNDLAACILNRLLEICDNIEEREFIDYYRSHSMVIGKSINVIPRNQDPIPAFATGIDDDGGLIVEYEDFTTEVLNTGEISIRVR